MNDGNRDPRSNAKRVNGRDVQPGEGRDEARNAKRDAQRDAQRDEDRGAARDEDRDATRVLAMAEQYGAVIRAWDQPALSLPRSLQLRHLEWMCTEVAAQVGSWPATRLHRWLGFVQAGMIAHGLVLPEGQAKMLDEAKRVHPEVDQDLLDHLNPDDGFELDIGGQG